MFRTSVLIAAAILQDPSPAVEVVERPIAYVSASTTASETTSTSKTVEAPEDRGLAIFLPGCEGQGRGSDRVVQGLRQSHGSIAIEIDDWTTGHASLFAYHLRGRSRNQGQAERIAGRIVQYQNSHPGRPVHLIGHSGGGAMAVFVLESLPADHKVTSAVLLAASISPKYDLSTALEHTDSGVWNYYSSRDLVFLRFGAVTMGTSDGKHSFAAGAVGFQTPGGLDYVHRRMYQEKLHQQPFESAMSNTGFRGTHMGYLNADFIASFVAPVMRDARPAAGAVDATAIVQSPKPEPAKTESAKPIPSTTEPAAAEVADAPTTPAIQPAAEPAVQSATANEELPSDDEADPTKKLPATSKAADAGDARK